MTPVCLLRRASVAGAALLGLAGLASASIHSWDYSPGQPGAQPGITRLSNAGGTFKEVSARFDGLTNQLTWSVDFSDRVTQGIAIALTGGVSPVHHRGATSMIYFDAAAAVRGRGAAPRLTAYSYNGSASSDSWFDADANPLNNNGRVQGDCIKTIFDTDWVLAASAADVTLAGGIAGRRFSFTIDATSLIGHTPMYTDNNSPNIPWTGTGFGERLGLYMFASQVFDAEYAAGGSIDDLGTELDGSLEGNSIRTDVPSPGAAVLALAGAGLWARRRR